MPNKILSPYELKVLFYTEVGHLQSTFTATTTHYDFEEEFKQDMVDTLDSMRFVSRCRYYIVVKNKELYTNESKDPFVNRLFVPSDFKGLKKSK